jgi:hypothetical protein
MTPDAIVAPELFTHIRIVMGMVLGLAVTRVLSGLISFVQHPGRVQLSAIHLGWALSMFLLILHFWWWEYRLYLLHSWTFPLYLFIISYTVLLFVLCALLFPDNIDEYGGYEQYFLARRKWFFGLLGLAFLFDYLDTLIKGREFAELFGTEYEIRIVGFVVLCVIAALTANRGFHRLLIGFTLVYQVSWIFRLFHTLD